MGITDAIKGSGCEGDDKMRIRSNTWCMCCAHVAPYEAGYMSFPVLGAMLLTQQYIARCGVCICMRMHVHGN